MLTPVALLCVLLTASQLGNSADSILLMLTALAGLSLQTLLSAKAPVLGSGTAHTSSQLHPFSDSQLERLYPARSVRLCQLDRGGLVMFIALPDGRIASRFMPPARRYAA